MPEGSSSSSSSSSSPPALSSARARGPLPLPRPSSSVALAPPGPSPSAPRLRSESIRSSLVVGVVSSMLWTSVDAIDSRRYTAPFIMTLALSITWPPASTSGSPPSAGLSSLSTSPEMCLRSRALSSTGYSSSTVSVDRPAIPSPINVVRPSGSFISVSMPRRTDMSARIGLTPSVDTLVEGAAAVQDKVPELMGGPVLSRRQRLVCENPPIHQPFLRQGVLKVGVDVPLHQALLKGQAGFQISRR
ncbi:hypothetical protein Trco_007171 [Trichoderma cornu-damae]|uniref:Uncharacterized protein n=1 Tax=Trichoderma cornu-damae TaxID=654480 RepID=A0A9P8TUG3_9HYPO|nr:hypothetical protein Trco_007171 [Trichoderma cornu-damae]